MAEDLSRAVPDAAQLGEKLGGAGVYDIIDKLVLPADGLRPRTGQPAVTTASTAYCPSRPLAAYSSEMRRSHIPENGTEMKVKSAASTVMLVGMIVVITSAVSIGLHLYCLVRRVTA